MRRSILGLEVETGILPGGEPGEISAKVLEASRALFAAVHRAYGGTSSDVYLENGGRLYLDVGVHPEICTAECDSPDDLTAADSANELLLARFAASCTDDDFLRRNRLGRIRIIKNNRSSDGNQFGCHENYLMKRSVDLTEAAQSLGGFLLSRQVICGAGDVLPSGRYVVAQRSDTLHFDEILGAGTIRNRGLISTRDEAHADGRWRRLHIIIGDSNRSQWTTRLKVGATDCVVRMIEDGLTFADLMPTRGVKVLPLLADASCSATVGLPWPNRLGLHEATAAQIQRGYLDAAREHFSGERENAGISRTLDQWEEVLDALATADPAAITARLGTRLDWVIKRHLIDRDAARRGTGSRAAGLNLMYHELGDDGVFARLCRAGLVEQIIDPQRVEYLVANPPETTRASARGRWIRAARAARKDISGTDWSRVSVSDTAPYGPRSFSMLDPFDPAPGGDVGIALGFLEKCAQAARKGRPIASTSELIPLLGRDRPGGERGLG